MAIQLENLGCRPVTGSLESDWFWRCRWCGFNVYVEIPREWPIPGYNSPPIIRMWIDDELIKKGWWNILEHQTKVINGKRLYAVCVYFGHSVNAEQLHFLFKERLCEVTGICNC